MHANLFFARSKNDNKVYQRSRSALLDANTIQKTLWKIEEDREQQKHRSQRSASPNMMDRPRLQMPRY